MNTDLKKTERIGENPCNQWLKKKLMQAGYSKRTLVQKLGIKEGSKIIFLKAPKNYDKTLCALPENVTVLERLKGPLDFIQFFTKSRAELQKELPRLKVNLAKNGMIWISWPKKSSGVKCDMSEDEVRRVALPLKLVDMKVCAVDEIWSGLKLVIRVDAR